MPRELTTTTEDLANAESHDWAAPAGKHRPAAPATSGRPRRLAIVGVALALLGFGAAFALGSALKHPATHSSALPPLAPVTGLRGPRQVSVQAIAPAPAIPPLRRAVARKSAARVNGRGAAGSPAGQSGSSTVSGSPQTSGAGATSPPSGRLSPSPSPSIAAPGPTPSSPSPSSGSSSGSSSSSSPPANPGSGSQGSGHGGGGFKPAHCSFCAGGSA